RGNAACSHGPDIGPPEVAGRHLRDGYGAGVDRPIKMRAEEVNRRHDNKPADDASGEECSRDARADDVADAEIFRRRVSAYGGSGKPLWLVVGCARPCSEQVLILKERVNSAESEAEEDSAGKTPAALSCNQNISAGCAFRVSEIAVLFDNELSPQ